MTNITITCFKSIKSSLPYAAPVKPIAEFLADWNSLSHLPLADKNTAEAFSMCAYADGKPRKKENILSMSGIVLDLDRPMTLEALADMGERLGDNKAFVLYSTHSSDPDQYKIRVILPLAEPVPVDVYELENFAVRAAKRLGTPPIDPACCSGAQVYFMPTCKPGTEEVHFVVVGDSTEPWGLTDFPELEADDKARYLDRKAKSGTPPSAIANKKSKQEIYAKLDKLVATRFGGVEPIYAEHVFHEYTEGHWKTISTPALKRDLMRGVFNESEAPEAVSAIVEVMAMRHFCEEFPSRGDNELASLICLQNGTLEPISEQMVPNRSENYLRTQMPYDYDPRAACDEWKRFLDQIFQPDPDKAQKVDLLQEYMGYLLIPSAKFQVMLWLLGPGSNGKSVINEVITAMLGDENVSAIGLGNLSKKFQAAELVGKLANISDEVDADGCLRDDTLKQAVAGNRIQGERKNKNPFNFRPFAKFVVAMNKLPRIKDTSHGFFRRLMLLTFNRIILEEEQDRDLVQKLQAELPGIFVWSLKGLQRLMKNGKFTEVPSSIAALAEFKEECNPVALFVRDLVITPDKVVDIGSKRGASKMLIHDVFRTYQVYCRTFGYMPLSDARFGREMSVLGIVATKSSGKRYYQVQLRTPKEAGLSGMDMPHVDQITRTSLEDEFGAAGLAA